MIIGLRFGLTTAVGGGTGVLLVLLLGVFQKLTPPHFWDWAAYCARSNWRRIGREAPPNLREVRAYCLTSSAKG